MAHRKKTRSRSGRDEGCTILIEDRHLLVVDKEPGVPVVPSSGRPEGSLVQRLLAMYARRGIRRPRLWVVHRIDRFTSGVVLFARSERAFAGLAGQFRARTAKREYLALCEGIPRPERGKLSGRLVADPRTHKMRQSRGRRGMEAVTHYEIRERLQGAALLSVTLETGRRNQIRVHLAAAGHPVVGDRSYGTPSDLIDRVALHATRLGFSHPITGRPVVVSSPMPVDIRRAHRRLRRA